LLDQADESEDPYMQLVYASELFFPFLFSLLTLFPVELKSHPEDIVLDKNEWQTRSILTSFDQGFVY